MDVSNAIFFFIVLLSSINIGCNLAIFVKMTKYF